MARIVVVLYRDGGSRDFIIEGFDKKIGIKHTKGRHIASVKIRGVVDDSGEKVYRWEAICRVSGESELFDKSKKACRKCEEYIFKSTGITYLS